MFRIDTASYGYRLSVKKKKKSWISFYLTFNSCRKMYYFILFYGLRVFSFTGELCGAIPSGYINLYMCLFSKLYFHFNYISTSVDGSILMYIRKSFLKHRQTHRFFFLI